MKDFAGQRKFKEASACKAQIVSMQTEVGKSEETLVKLSAETQELKLEIEEKVKELDQT